ncbi:MAG TPA: cation:dicarboxylase symporter family transporter, partial [Opitutales bacterium]|nr:cation:dicarboxylase symporter family transporter [Opitutales bacterium]
MSTPTKSPRGGIFRPLYAQVALAAVVGVLIGYFYPAYGMALQPLGDGFIQLVRLLLPPVIFCTIVTGIARMDNLKQAGRIGLKALIYFEVVSTFALVIGLLVVNVLQPGAGMNADAQKLGAKLPPAYAVHAPVTEGVVARLANNPMLQIIAAAVLTGIVLSLFRKTGKPAIKLIDATSHALFYAVQLVMRFAPLGALGGAAFTVGAFGLVS